MRMIDLNFGSYQQGKCFGTHFFLLPSHTGGKILSFKSEIPQKGCQPLE